MFKNINITSSHPIFLYDENYYNKMSTGALVQEDTTCRSATFRWKIACFSSISRAFSAAAAVGKHKYTVFDTEYCISLLIYL